MFKLKRKEAEKDIAKRILDLCDDGDYGLCSPPMDAQVALNELCRYILGDDWYSIGMSPAVAQVNTEIVYEIERKLNLKRLF